METQMHSSGEERTFATGAVRDAATKKPMIHLISPFFLQDLGEWLRFACRDRKPKPYPPRNWEQGMPFSETLGSGLRHVVAIMEGDISEDHIAAIGFMAMALAHYRHEIKAGRMDPVIDDMPHYGDQDRFDKFGDRYLIELRRRIANGAILSDRENDLLQEAFADPPPNYVMGVDPRTFVDPRPEDRQIVHIPTEKIVPTFYIAGPMRGIEDYNFPAFDRARDRGKRMGFHIISPADLDRGAGIQENSPEIKDPEYVRIIVQRDMNVLLNILKAEKGDGIAVLPGWRNSTGAMAEVRIGLWLGLKIVDARNFSSTPDLLETD